MRRVMRWAGTGLFFLVAALCLATVLVPPFLDRIYYRGAVSGHFDGQRFFNPDGADDPGPPGGGSRGGFIARRLFGDETRPTWPERIEVAPATRDDLLPILPPAVVMVEASAEEAAATSMRAIWIGHATVLVTVGSFNILTDPVWSERVGPFGFGPRRVAAPGMALESLPPIDLVLISHNHYDHLDLQTLKRLWERDRPVIVTSLGNDAILRSHGIDAVSADWGRRITVPTPIRVSEGGVWSGPVEVIVTRNHHWGSRWFADRNRALWSSFVVRLPGGNIFFAGDTGFGDGRWPAEARRHGPIRLALIPIGAFRFAPGQMATSSHIGPGEAALVFDRLGASTGIPIHWGTFRLSDEGWNTPPRLLDIATACLGIAGFASVAIGRTVEIPPLGAAPRPPTATRAEAAACLATPTAQALR